MEEAQEVDHFRQRFTQAGAVMVPHLLSAPDLATLSKPFEGAAGRRHAGIGCDVIRDIEGNAALGALAVSLGGAGARLVRVIAFDKTTAANWFVPWHQDRSIAVSRRVETDGYTNWTVKGGLVHVEPPVALLEAMVTLRVHFDDCNEDAGPLEVIPGSHTLGRLGMADIAAGITRRNALVCLADRGDILAMRPLLLHRSQRARRPQRRRVLHLEYSAATLPNGLDWSLAGAASSEVLN